jgi:hypothetical protein
MTTRLPRSTNILCIEVFFDASGFWRYNLIVNTARVLVGANGQPVIEPRVVAVGIELPNATDPAAHPWDVLRHVCVAEEVNFPLAVRHHVLVFATHLIHNFSVEQQGRPS